MGSQHPMAIGIETNHRYKGPPSGCTVQNGDIIGFLRGFASPFGRPVSARLSPDSVRPVGARDLRTPRPASLDPMPYLASATPGRSSCSTVSNGRTLIGDADYFPCGSVNETTTAVPCCRRNDTCMEGGLCSGPKKDKEEDKDEDGKEDEDPVVTGYYASGCTDPSFADPACKRLCGKYATRARPSRPPMEEVANGSRPVTSVAGDVVYNGTGWYWRCCADHHDVDCSKPLSDETFALSPPNELKAYFRIPATGFAFTSATAPSAPSASSPAAPAPSSGGLSHGGAAGLGVGVTISAVLVAWAAWFLVRRARAKRAEPAEIPGGSSGGDGINPFATPTPRHTE